jgi:hypothetical protein
MKTMMFFQISRTILNIEEKNSINSIVQTSLGMV